MELKARHVPIKWRYKQNALGGYFCESLSVCEIRGKNLAIRYMAVQIYVRILHT